MKVKEFVKMLLEHPDAEVFVCRAPAEGCSVGLAFTPASPAQVTTSISSRFYVFESCGDISAHNIPPLAEFKRRSKND